MDAEIGQISVFLAKEGRTFETILDPNSDLLNTSGVRWSDFKSDGVDCRFIYFETPSTKSNPPWLDFVNEKLTEENRIKFHAKTLSANGILLVEIEKRIFVATFGRSASSHLVRRALESDFGIKTAMNMCGNEELRQTKSQSNSIAITQIDRQVSKPSDALAGLHPVLKTPSLVFLWNQEVGYGETEVHARVQA